MSKKTDKLIGDREGSPVGLRKQSVVENVLWKCAGFTSRGNHDKSDDEICDLACVYVYEAN